MKKLLATLAVLTIAVAGATSPAKAEGKHDFSLTNGTNAVVKAIYYKRTGDAKDPWTALEGEDGETKWQKGESAPCYLESPKYDHDCEVDLKVVTANGDEWTCGPVELCDNDGNQVVKKIRVYMQGSNLMWSDAAE